MTLIGHLYGISAPARRATGIELDPFTIVKLRNVPGEGAGSRKHQRLAGQMLGRWVRRLEGALHIDDHRVQLISDVRSANSVRTTFFRRHHSYDRGSTHSDGGIMRVLDEAPEHLAFAVLLRPHFILPLYLAAADVINRGGRY